MSKSIKTLFGSSKGISFNIKSLTICAAKYVTSNEIFWSTDKGCYDSEASDWDED
jgi:hypothetical protein